MLDTQLMAKLEEISRQPSSPILPDLQGDIQEVLVNCQVHRNSLNLPPHTSECMEMLVVCRGTVTELIEGKQLPLKAGDILLSSLGAVYFSVGYFAKETFPGPVCAL